MGHVERSQRQIQRDIQLSMILQKKKKTFDNYLLSMSADCRYLGITRNKSTFKECSGFFSASFLIRTDLQGTVNILQTESSS